jgi:G3E family GTPase
VNGAATLDAHEEAVKQAAVADRIVLSKTDLLSDGARENALRARLASLNPTVRILDAARGEADAARLLDAGLYDPDGKAPDVRK